MRENRSSHLVGWKTHPTILPRPGIELTTSRSPWRQHDQGVLRANHSATAAVILHQSNYNSLMWYVRLLDRSQTCMYNYGSDGLIKPTDFNMFNSKVDRPPFIM